MTFQIQIPLLCTKIPSSKSMYVQSHGKKQGTSICQPYNEDWSVIFQDTGNILRLHPFMSQAINPRLKLLGQGCATGFTIPSISADPSRCILTLSRPPSHIHTKRRTRYAPSLRRPQLLEATSMASSTSPSSKTQTATSRRHWCRTM